MIQITGQNLISLLTRLMRSARKHWLVVIVLFAGVAARLYGVWCYQNAPNSDFGVVALMAKHMAEARDFPVFFYGQTYMGSLEPAVSALFCRIFGWTPFFVCSGTAFLGFLVLLVVYRWSHDASDKNGALAGLIFCIIGPEMYFAYMATPRGGYASTILLSTLVLWLTCRLIQSEAFSSSCFSNRTTGRRIGGFFLLGFIAGLGWWSNQLIAPSLFTACLMLIIYLRGRIFSIRPVAGCCGFLLGSLPWWVWNTTNNWASFAFRRSIGQTPPSEGFKLFLLERMPGLLDLTAGRVWLRSIMLVLYILCIGAAAWVLLPRMGPDRRKNANIYLAMAFLFFPVFACVFSSSHFARLPTTRYLLPLFPVLGVMVGSAISYLVKHTRYGLGWLPLVIIIGWQGQSLQKAYSYKKATNTIWNSSQELGRVLQREGIKTCLASYNSNWLNVALREKFCFCSLEGERYSPYEKRAEIADDIAVMDYPWLSAFLKSVNGKSRRIDLAGHCIFFDFSFPQTALRMIPPTAWTYAWDMKGRNVIDSLTDLNIDTHWRGYAEGPALDRLEIAFQAPESVCCLRLLSKDGYYPESWQIEGQDALSGKWIELMPLIGCHFFFYSGPRLYWHGTGFRLEGRFSPVTVSALRIIFHETRGRNLEISELQILGSSPEGNVPSESESIEQIIALLKQRGVTTLYSDRWVANQVASALPAVAAQVEPAIFQRTIQTPVLIRKYLLRKWKPVPITFSPTSALLPRTENAPLCRESLAMREVVMRETEVGPWTLFDYSSGQWRPTYSSHSGLCWAGFACFLSDSFAYKKRYAYDKIEAAESLGTTHSNKYEELLLKALKNNPDYQPALIRMIRFLHENGRKHEARRFEQHYKDMTVPQTPSRIVFDNGVEFLGLSIEKNVLQPGASTWITYFWKCPPREDHTMYVAFVHIDSDDTRFQDDHVLLGNYDMHELLFQPEQEIFREERILKVPPDAKPGVYHIGLGLVDSKTDKRLRLVTDLPQKEKRRATLPVSIVIKPAL